ncbi:MAG TPA: hypothetical protein PKV84_02955 [Candidatus Omnitrophota bacterium]|nr:hypothetical protein [Candidatus Omnitrophota bacterium]
MEEAKKPCCCCGILIGALVIVFAWWKVAWGAIALTVLGAVIIIKELIGQCCCQSKECKPKPGN